MEACFPKHILLKKVWRREGGARRVACSRGVPTAFDLMTQRADAYLICNNALKFVKYR